MEDLSFFLGIPEFSRSFPESLVSSLIVYNGGFSGTQSVALVCTTICIRTFKKRGRKRMREKEREREKESD